MSHNCTFAAPDKPCGDHHKDACTNIIDHNNSLIIFHDDIYLSILIRWSQTSSQSLSSIKCPISRPPIPTPMPLCTCLSTKDQQVVAIAHSEEHQVEIPMGTDQPGRNSSDDLQVRVEQESRDAMQRVGGSG